MSTERADHQPLPGLHSAPHPGRVLRSEFLEPSGLSAHALAMALRIPATRISEILRERRGITADTALRLGLYFGAPARFWLDLQIEFDLAVAEEGAEAVSRGEIRPHPEWKSGGRFASRKDS